MAELRLTWKDQLENYENWTRRRNINLVRQQELAWIITMNTSNQHYSETEERSLSIPLHYFVAQLQRKKLILVLDLTRSEGTKEDTPMCMNINLSNI